MRHFTHLLAIAGLAVLFSCNHGKQANKVNIPGNLKPGKYCYTALFEKDSASLNMVINKYGSVTGHLYIGYGEIKPGATEREINMGDISKGEFKGDTLFADYTFTSGTKFKNIYTNPIALLHKGDSLILGSGRVMNYLGRAYFDPQTPIDFQKSRFRFKRADCK